MTLGTGAQALEYRGSEAAKIGLEEPVLASWRSRLAVAALLREGLLNPKQTLKGAPSWDASRASLDGTFGSPGLRTQPQPCLVLNSARPHVASFLVAPPLCHLFTLNPKTLRAPAQPCLLLDSA